MCVVERRVRWFGGSDISSQPPSTYEPALTELIDAFSADFFQNIERHETVT
jgi:hypothetical protein